MCCFSGPVEHVAKTHIFARQASNGRQMLAYQMQYASRSPVAMILPLPVARGLASGDAKPSPDTNHTPLVEFINLKDYPNFFVDMGRAFPKFEGARHPARLVIPACSPWR